MLNKKLLFIDFRDSFTFNLISLIKKYFLKVEIIDYQQVLAADLDLYDTVILGPGPGSPSEYSELYPSLKRIVGNVHLLGVCLGHQIIAEVLGLECRKISEPIHGQSILLRKLPPILSLKPFYAQFYNSWRVVSGRGISEDYTLIEESDSIVCILGPKLVGVQFHLESVGTSCPDLIFEKLVDLLYNGHYDLATDRCIRPSNN